MDLLSGTLAHFWLGPLFLKDQEQGHLQSSGDGEGGVAQRSEASPPALTLSHRSGHNNLADRRGKRQDAGWHCSCSTEAGSSREVAKWSQETFRGSLNLINLQFLFSLLIVIKSF